MMPIKFIPCFIMFMGIMGMAVHDNNSKDFCTAMSNTVHRDLADPSI